MHLLQTQPGLISDGDEPIDLIQSPGDLLVLSAADTDLSVLSAGLADISAEGFPTCRLCSWLQLKHPFSVDAYLQRMAGAAQKIAVRLLGGKAYWAYGVEQLQILAKETDLQVFFLPGDDKDDPETFDLNDDSEQARRLWTYLAQGGLSNAAAFWQALAGRDALPAKPVLEVGEFAKHEAPDPIGVIFYRAHFLAGNTAPIAAVCETLKARGHGVVALYVSSLKDPRVAAIVREKLSGVCAIIATTGFSVSKPGKDFAVEAFAGLNVPIIQGIHAACTKADWQDSPRGLGPRDVAMNVALPEVDGRILGAPISFKSVGQHDPRTDCYVSSYEAYQPGVERTVARALPTNALSTSALSKRALLKHALLTGGESVAENGSISEKGKTAEAGKVALILANYPNKDGRLANGVGLDTPQSAVEILRSLGITDFADGQALMTRLRTTTTNAKRGEGARLPIAAYQAAYVHLPQDLRDQVQGRWGSPDQDPFFGDGGFHLPILDLGPALMMVQPARGYHIDPEATYHDPALVPPHGYVAAYLALQEWGVTDVIHVGKHGNLEWLPGKAVGLSQTCWPEALMPGARNLYPFIINDPGEGTQAKRRLGATIISHLTPPLTRAETYGDLAALERLVDEFYLASQGDPRRADLLKDQILDQVRDLGLDKDLGLKAEASEDEQLGALDGYLCELKELQIRDGLHILGQAPQGTQRRDLLLALLRLESGERPSFMKALAEDLGLGFDPLTADLGAPWTGPRPAALAALESRLETTETRPLDTTSLTSTSSETAFSEAPFSEAIPSDVPPSDVPPSDAKSPDARPSEASPLNTPLPPRPWRTVGDTVERMEIYARNLLCGADEFTAPGPISHALQTVHAPALAAKLEESAFDEIANLRAALGGRFVPPSPSGAPTRGREDVLPTGRNFYSIDPRSLPTPAAWRLGWESAALLLDLHRQDQGAYPKSLLVSAWGTANMRTGGDDLAQVLALMGVQPTWDQASGRVTGFEVMPLTVLDRPRVDVTLRVSGFFRDAFPAQIDLIDSAARQVMAQDEPLNMNPARARYLSEIEDGAKAQAAGSRVFGSRPGAYGAGLQALIDEGGWHTQQDLGESYINWSAYAYGAGQEGARDAQGFRTRLSQVEAVVQNQDNREHDILDSDDYYQFLGGAAAAVEGARGTAPVTYLNDHSRPQRPRIQTLKSEIGRIVRGRAANPKWIAGCQRHGYKGAFEMAATLDYLFAFAATTGLVDDHHFDQLYRAYLEDDQVRAWIAEVNPDALQEMKARFQEALDRGLWQSKLNHLSALEA